MQYQVQEIEDAGLTAGEEQALENRRKVLSNASAIRDRLAQSYALLPAVMMPQALWIFWGKPPTRWMPLRS